MCQDGLVSLYSLYSGGPVMLLKALGRIWFGAWFSVQVEASGFWFFFFTYYNIFSALCSDERKFSIFAMSCRGKMFRNYSETLLTKAFRTSQDCFDQDEKEMKIWPLGQSIVVNCGS